MDQKGRQALAARLQPIFVKHCIERAISFGALARGDVSRYSTRYPNGLPDLTPGHVYRKVDAERGLDAADALVTNCRAALDQLQQNDESNDG